MVTEAEDMFSEMLYEKAIQFDTAIPDMREGSFRNKLKQWVNSDNSEYREYKKANKEGIMLYNGHLLIADTSSGPKRLFFTSV